MRTREKARISPGTNNRENIPHGISQENEKKPSREHIQSNYNI